MIKHGDKSDTFNCDLCGSKFNEEWKMLAHKKTHTKFNCEQAQLRLCKLGPGTLF